MNASPPSPSRSLKACQHREMVAVAAAGRRWLVLALAWGALHWIVPRIGELRPDLEIEAGRVLGVPVRIGSITARSEGLVPSFELRDVVLLDPQGREALRLPPSDRGAVAALAVEPRLRPALHRPAASSTSAAPPTAASSWPAWTFRAPATTRARRPTGSSARPNSSSRADWIRWTDEQRGAPPLALSQVDFVMRNGARRHRCGWTRRRRRNGASASACAACSASRCCPAARRWQQWERRDARRFRARSTCRSCAATPTSASRSRGPGRGAGLGRHRQGAGGRRHGRRRAGRRHGHAGPRTGAAGAAVGLGPPRRQAPRGRLRVPDAGPAVPHAGRPALAGRQCLRGVERGRRAGRRRAANCAPTSWTWAP